VAIPETIPFIGWSWADLLFLLFATTLLGTGLLVVLGRNIIRSGLWMIACFASLAGLYVLLGATLIAAAQVLIYIGAISVLVLFAVMLTQTKAAPTRLAFHHQAWAGALAAVGLALLLGLVVASTAWPGKGPRTASPADQLARLLFSDYVLAFEVVSVLLLAAVIGGVFLAKREDEPEESIVPSDGAPPGRWPGEEQGSS
jgi:NADH:ubiquinone oxidoreductase subunit 6 (subunit J)